MAPTPLPSTPAAGGRHRKPRQRRLGGRRAGVVAGAVPVAVAVFASPSAFAAGRDGAGAQAASATVKDDGADQRIAGNLNVRVDDPRLGPEVSGVVLDAKSDKVIWGHNASTALMPASNAKLFTAATALTVLGPDHRFTTKVTYTNGTLTLVGGGDRMLTTADLKALAETAVTTLEARGVETVRVRVDDSLFPAPTLANGWRPDYYPEEVAPVRALVVDGHSVLDTSLDAGQVFASQLTAAGIGVEGEVGRGRAGRAEETLGRHRSPELSTVVKRMLKVSDNNIAETLLRMSALGAGRPATFEGGTATVRKVLGERYGVPLAGVQLYDGSGLSRADRIPATALAEVLDVATDHRQTLGAVIDGLPVAGEAGSTLGPEWGRFDDPHSLCAVGKVSAKTGTLTGAIALSGVTRGEDGRIRVFSFVENGATAGPADIKDAMDGLAATVNGCWA
ncbi:peptidase S13 [Streptomyces albus subsp. albus]|nr:peptidase S13 [Streptomyces albus subsp. albus]